MGDWVWVLSWWAVFGFFAFTAAAIFRGRWEWIAVQLHLGLFLFSLVGLLSLNGQRGPFGSPIVIGDIQVQAYAIGAAFISVAVLVLTHYELFGLPAPPERRPLAVTYRHTLHAPSEHLGMRLWRGAHRRWPGLFRGTDGIRPNALEPGHRPD